MWRSLVGLEDFGADGPPEDALQAAFDRLDLDKNGSVSRQELKDIIIKGWGGSETDQAVSSMISWADADADGEIDFDEFRSMLLGPDSS